MVSTQPTEKFSRFSHTRPTCNIMVISEDKFPKIYLRYR